MIMNKPAKIILSKKLGLLLIGGEHHILHLIPVAAELEKNSAIETTIYVTTTREQQACKAVLMGLGASKIDVSILTANSILKRVSPKLAVLLCNLKLWRGLDALIVAERTSTILRHVSKHLPPFIHIPHGAGDRAKSYDKRIKHFDHVLVAGSKDKKRMLELGLVTDDSCHVTGYIKPFAVSLLYPDRPTVFKNNQPTVLYNPHFNKKLSSWTPYGFDLLEAFAQRQDMNFIIAPHMRLFSKATSRERIKVEAYAKYDNIHVDLGSKQSTDMTYTRAADIYLGDVSSQVYEFLSTPKPCVFISPPNTKWHDNPDYAHWRYGPVCESVADVMISLAQAQTDTTDYAKVQSEGCLAALGDPKWNPIDRAAKVVTAILDAP